MLGATVGVRTAEPADGGWALVLDGGVPAGLDAVFTGAMPGFPADRLCRCPVCGGAALPLVTGMAVTPGNILVLDADVTVCASGRHAAISMPAWRSAAARAGRASPDRAQAVPVRPVGIGGRLEKPLAAPALAAVLSGGGAPLLYDPRAQVVLPADAVPVPAADLRPAALVFHEDALPERFSLAIEPTTLCNFRCGFCYGRHLPQGSLGFDDYRHILDSVPNLRAVQLTGEGEPLINRSIVAMIETAHSRGIWTHLTTNGSLLTDSACEALVSSGVNSIAVSMEGFTRERFERLRPKSSFHGVLDGIRRLAAARARRGTDLTLRLWVSIFRETMGDLPAIETFARELGIDLVEHQVLNPMPAYSRFYDDQTKRNAISFGDMAAFAADEAQPPELRQAFRQLLGDSGKRHCEAFMDYLLVNVGLEVTPCFQLKTPAFPSFGTLKTRSFAEIWDGPAFTGFRFALQHGLISAHCAGCSLVASHVPDGGGP